MISAVPEARRWFNRLATFLALAAGLALGAALFNENVWSKVYSRAPVTYYDVRLLTERVSPGQPLQVLVEVDKRRHCPVEILELVRPAGDELAPWVQVGHLLAPLFPIGDNEPKAFAVVLPSRLFPVGKYVYDRFSHYLCGQGQIYTYGSGPLPFEIVPPEQEPRP
jgi:hypothetical protein